MVGAQNDPATVSESDEDKQCTHHESDQVGEGWTQGDEKNVVWLEVGEETQNTDPDEEDTQTKQDAGDVVVMQSTFIDLNEKVNIISIQKSSFDANHTFNSC